MSPIKQDLFRSISPICEREEPMSIDQIGYTQYLYDESLSPIPHNNSNLQMQKLFSKFAEGTEEGPVSRSGLESGSCTVSPFGYSERTQIQTKAPRKDPIMLLETGETRATSASSGPQFTNQSVDGPPQERMPIAR